MALLADAARPCRPELGPRFSVSGVRLAPSQLAATLRGWAIGQAGWLALAVNATELHRGPDSDSLPSVVRATLYR
jgi:hypothetical protein